MSRLPPGISGAATIEFAPARLMRIKAGGNFHRRIPGRLEPRIEEAARGMIELLGIDNVMFHVGDLETAIPFYESCGFVLKFRIDEKQMALFDVGPEGPGLVIRTDEGSSAGRLWVEVRNADEIRQTLLARGTASTRIETATGITCEIVDPFGNRIGFADYSKRPELARR